MCHFNPKTLVIGLLVMLTITILGGMPYQAVAAERSTVHGQGVPQTPPSTPVSNPNCQTLFVATQSYMVDNDTNQALDITEGLIDPAHRIVAYSTIRIYPEGTDGQITGIGFSGHNRRIVTSGCLLQDALTRMENAYPAYDVIPL